MNLSPHLPEVFSHWSYTSRTQDGDVSYSMDGDRTQDGNAWRMDLASDPQLAEDQLNRAERQVAASQAALSQASTRFDRLLSGLEDRDTSQVAFSTAETEAEPLPEPERELLMWIDTIQPGEVSYGLGLIPTGDLREAREKIQGMTQNLLRLITHHAWVETQLEGRLLARTVVRHSGDMETAWGAAVLPEEYSMHSRSLRLALASRITLLRTFTIAAGGAAKLSLLVATPGGALLALPAAWKFVESILEQIDQYQTIKQGTMER